MHFMEWGTSGSLVGCLHYPIERMCEQPSKEVRVIAGARSAHR